MQHISERGWAWLALIGCVVAALARPAEACSCGKPESDEEAFDGADTVVVATVVAKSPPPTSAPWQIVYDLDVEGVWKGSVPRKAKLSTGQGGGDCGRDEIAKGDRWVFFIRARGPAAVLTTSICDASRPATKKLVDALTAKRGKPKAPTK